MVRVFSFCMSSLYNNLADVYEMMYRSFINYDEEFIFYSGKLKKYSCHSVTELGCGTGNLAEKFIADGFNYTGLDLSKSMLEIAAKKFPSGKFMEADMRNFNLPEKQDGCFFAGRTSAYLTGERDMEEALISIHKNLAQNGIVCFDCIDADKFIPLIKGGKQIVHTASYRERRFHRASYWTSVENAQSAFNWESVYFEVDDKRNKKEIGRDNSALRAFTKSEIENALNNTGFKMLEAEDRPSYAFDTFVILAQKLI